MSLIGELRIRARHIIGPVLGICAVGYFAYHAVHGDRGLIAWRQLTQTVEASRATLAALSAERRALEHRVGLLNAETLDTDMLDERARVMLNYGYADDVVILYSSGQ